VEVLRRASGGWTAHVALIVLLVQLFAAGFATAAHAATPRIDAFGNVLCLSGEPGAARPAGGSSGIHECCTFGCGNAFSSFAKPVEPLVQPVFYPRSVVVVPTEPAIPSAHGRPSRPGSPRAPPQAI
jgi:hypothetical protein